MDVRFLKTVSGAYVTKNSLHDVITEDQLFDDVYSLIKELRDDDIELYNLLYDTNVLQQQNIISRYFDFQYNDDVLQEADPITLLAVGGIAALLSYIYAGRLTQGLFSAGAKVGKVMAKIGHFLSKRGNYWKFRYAIIQQNAEKCYKICDVNEENLSAWSYFSVGSKPPPLADVKGYKQADCLKKCYIKYSIESISLLGKSYLICLKRTGGFNKIESLRPDDMIKTLAGLQLSSSCHDYYKEMKEGFAAFDDLLDYVFGRDNAKKTEAMRELRDKMIEYKNQVARIQNLSQFK